MDSEQFVSEHLLTGTNSRPKENGDYHHHSQHSLDPVDPLMGPGGHNHLLRHEMLSDAMLGHVGSGDSGLPGLHSRDRDQVKWALASTGSQLPPSPLARAVQSVIKCSQGNTGARLLNTLTRPPHTLYLNNTRHLTSCLITRSPCHSTFNTYCSLDDCEGDD